jgi:hypothetical protein
VIVYLSLPNSIYDSRLVDVLFNNLLILIVLKYVLWKKINVVSHVTFSSTCFYCTSGKYHVSWDDFGKLAARFIYVCITYCCDYDNNFLMISISHRGWFCSGLCTAVTNNNQYKYSLCNMSTCIILIHFFGVW